MIGRFELDKIYNEDCYQAIKDIPDKSIDLIVTDIPYDYVGMGSSSGAFGANKRDYHAQYEKICQNTNRDRLSKNRRRNECEYGDFSYGIDIKILDEFVRVCKKINAYIWCSKKQIPEILNYFLDKGCNWDLITWHKNNPIPTGHNTFISDTEYCLCFRESGVCLGGTYESKKHYYITNCNKSDKNKFEHPTIKPVNIIENLITNSSNGGGVVLDTFMGSGTTAVACKNTDRHFIGFEIDKHWWEVANDRLNNIDANGQMSLFTF